jgi:hypothetical protein
VNLDLWGYKPEVIARAGMTVIKLDGTRLVRAILAHANRTRVPRRDIEVFVNRCVATARRRCDAYLRSGLCRPEDQP